MVTWSAQIDDERMVTRRKFVHHLCNTQAWHVVHAITVECLVHNISSHPGDQNQSDSWTDMRTDRKHLVQLVAEEQSQTDSRADPQKSPETIEQQVLRHRQSDDPGERRRNRAEPWNEF